jgi:hypothetical protein
MNTLRSKVHHHYRKISRTRNDSLTSVKEEEDERTKTELPKDRTSGPKIVHQTDAINPLMARRFKRANALVLVIQELRKLHESLLSELFFHKCSFSGSGVFISTQDLSTIGLDQSTIEFMFRDPELLSYRDDDDVDTTHFNRVSQESILAVLNVAARMPYNPFVTSLPY